MSGHKRKPGESQTYAKRRAAAIEQSKNNPASEWVEPTQIFGLTMYDIYGSEPRKQLAEVDAEGREVTIEVSIDELEKELRCNSCLEIYVDTQLNTHCLHRNCKRCVVELCKMKDGNNASRCPQCREHIQSKRNFVNDRRYDDLILGLYPPENRVDQIEDWTFQSRVKSITSANLHRDRVEEMKSKRQEMIRDGKISNDPAYYAAQAAAAAAAASSAAPSSSSTIGRRREPTTVIPTPRPMHFVLTPFRQNTMPYRLTFPYISVLSNTKIKTLQQYLHLKFPSVDVEQKMFVISTFVNHENVPFEDENMMVREIQDKYWDRNTPDLRVYYTLESRDGVEDD